MPDWKKRVLGALHGIEFHDASLQNQSTQALHRYLIRQRDPSTYVLKVALEVLRGTALPQPDKKEWIVDLVFRERLWKAASWTLHGPVDADADQRLVVRKLTCAARIVQRQLDAAAKEKVRNGEFLLAN